MICKRCGRLYTCPDPPIVSDGEVTEIATTDWCADCNAYVMTVLYRGRSAFGPKHPINLYDPIKHKGGDNANT